MDTEKTTLSKKAEILEKQKKYLWPNHLLYYTEPLPLERGDGMYVWDVDGKKYLDFFGGILTTSVGHNRPEVTEAVREQAEKLIHSLHAIPERSAREPRRKNGGDYARQIAGFLLHAIGNGCR